MRPTDGVVVERERAAQVIHARHDLLEIFRNSVEESHLVEQALLAALGAGPIVALDIYDERIVQLPEILNSVEDPAHLVVGVTKRGGINLHHVRIDLLVIGIE